MTEEEAKDKWCPQSQLDTQITVSGNRLQQVNMGNCIGSACMAWRWRLPPFANEPKGGDGFCGLAGKP